MRKEVYATSGTRMTVRLFGGWDFNADDARTRDVARTGYAKGVPMGADLPAAPKGAKAPTFLIAALKDSMGANLDRIQVVKGWLERDGKTTHEKVYDVAWGDADRRKPGADGKLPPVGDTVDVARATWTDTIGDPDLTVAWSDPDFDAKQPAFYYVRVLEIPTPRWTAYDALALRREDVERRSHEAPGARLDVADLVRAVSFGHATRTALGWALLLGSCLTAAVRPATAGEGGSSHYNPGTMGDFAMALIGRPASTSATTRSSSTGASTRRASGGSWSRTWISRPG